MSEANGTAARGTTVPRVTPLELIVATDVMGAIGKDGALPWRLRGDMKYFCEMTMGGVLIMGRKTYASIGRPLPGRLSVVVTRRPPTAALPPSAGQGVVYAGSPEQALWNARAIAGYHDEMTRIFVVGGAQIYEALLSYVSTIWLTVVHTRVGEADARMPDGWLNDFVVGTRIPARPHPDDELVFDHARLDRV